MAWIAPVVAGGVSLVGDVVNSAGQSGANAKNVQMNTDNIAAAKQRQEEAQTFNWASAGRAMDFSAQQVSQQEAFQRGMTSQVENYDTQMSNTAMQRRVQDLKDAGINPLLAIGQGGASAPTVNTPTGASAQGSQASIGPGQVPGMIPAQNSLSAFGNLGGIVNSSLQAAKTMADIDQVKAETEKTKYESGNTLPAQVEQIKAMTGLNDEQSLQAHTNIQLLGEQIDKTRNEAGESLSRQSLNNSLESLNGQNLQVLKATRDALISSANSDAQAKLFGLTKQENMSDIQKTKFGQIINYLNTALEPVLNAVGAAKGTNMLPGASYIPQRAPQ